MARRHFNGLLAWVDQGHMDGEPAAAAAAHGIAPKHGEAP